MLRRWLSLFVVLGIAGIAVVSGTEFFGEHAAAYAPAGLYAAQGDPDTQIMQLFDTPGTFTGSFAPPSSVRHEREPASRTGRRRSRSAVNATVPSNDIALTLLDPSGTSVGSSDEATSPEAVSYSASSLATGKWTAKVCSSPTPAVDVFVAPYTYDGSYTISDTPLPDTAILPLPGVPTANAGTPTPVYAAGKLTFAPETIIDPQRTEGEPVSFFPPTAATGRAAPSAPRRSSRGSTARRTAVSSSTS